jgi:hypothetical protein
MPDEVLAGFEQHDDQGVAPDGPGLALGRHGGSVGRSADGKASERRRVRFRRSRLMAALLEHKDLTGCHRWARSSSELVAVARKPGGAAYLGGVQRCGLVHLCSHCQGLIASRRAVEIQQAIDGWSAEGGDVLMVTLTLSHGPAHPLADTLGALKAAGRRLAQHRAFKAATAAAGFIGRVVATELTHGEANGWHPHQHQLWFVRRGVDQAALQAVLADAWRASIEAEGFGASVAHGVKVNGARRAAGYVAKMAAGDGWGMADEIARAASKTGRQGSRSVWQLVDVLGDAAAPAEARQRDARLLREYADATHGTRALSWSPGLKRRFEVAERTDAELSDAEEQQDAELLALIEPADWCMVAREQVQPEVLEAAERGGQLAVTALLQRLRAIHQGRPLDARHGAPPGGGGAAEAAQPI